MMDSVPWFFNIIRLISLYPFFSRNELNVADTVSRHYNEAQVRELNTHCRGKYHCMANLLFDWFEFTQPGKTVVHIT